MPRIWVEFTEDATGQWGCMGGSSNTARDVLGNAVQTAGLNWGDAAAAEMVESLCGAMYWHCQGGV